MQVKVSVDTSQVQAAADKKLMQIKLVQTQVLDQIGRQELVAAKTRIITTKTDPDGKAWAPWSMATLRQRRRAGNAARGLLYRTGVLLNSISYTVSRGVLTIFSNDQKARYLQFGTPKMPARPFLGFGNRINSIIDTVRKALND